MSKRKLGQLYIDYTPNYSNVKIKIKQSRVEDEEEKPVPGLPEKPKDPSEKLDPVTGKPLPGIDPITGKPIPSIDPVTGKPITGDPSIPPGEGPPPEDGKPPGEGAPPEDGKPPEEGAPPEDGKPPEPAPPTPDEPLLPPEEYERRFIESEKNKDANAARAAIVGALRSYVKEYNQEFRNNVESAILGPVEEVIADDLLMHEHAKLVEGSYRNFEKGIEHVAEYLSDPKNHYIEDFGKWQIDKDLSTIDNVVYFQAGEEGVKKVAVACRGTVTGADWNANVNIMLNRGETTKRLVNADNQMVKVLSKYGKMVERKNISVAGHSQGGAVSMYLAEKYNLPGYHYQPAVSLDAKARINGMKVGNEPFQPREEPNFASIAEEGIAEAERTRLAPGPAGAGEIGGPPPIESVKLTDPQRSIYGERNRSWFLNQDEFVHDIKNGAREPQNIFRTPLDPVSVVSMTGIKNEAYKVNLINPVVKDGAHESFIKIHSLDQFHPEPAPLTGEIAGQAAANLERSVLTRAAAEATTVSVSRATTAAALRGGLKAAGAAVGVGLTLKDTVDGMKNIMNNSTLSKTDKAVLGTTELTKQAASFGLSTVASGAAEAAIGPALASALAGSAPAIVASGGTLLVGLVIGAAVAVGVTMLGDFAKEHYKDIEHGFETAGKGIVKAAKTVEHGLINVGKKISGGLRKAGRKLKKAFHF